MTADFSATSARRVGIVTFGYENFRPFAEQVAQQGFFSANVGDSMQSFAVRSLVRRLGVSPQDIVDVNRDTLRHYDGPPIRLVMNGVFYDWSFPTPPQVQPIFIGTCVKAATIERFQDYFRRHQPIGCRDRTTCDAFRAVGVDAFVSGCLTLTLPLRQAAPVDGQVLVVHGSGAGQLPSAVLDHMPARVSGNCDFVFQRLPRFEHPLGERARTECERYAAALLDRFAASARLIVTPLHHAAAPCMAMGIPVIVCRTQNDPRFSFLGELTPIFTPDRFDDIDWDPKPVDLAPLRQHLTDLVARALAPAA